MESYQFSSLFDELLSTCLYSYNITHHSVSVTNTNVETEDILSDLDFLQSIPI